MEFLKGQHGTQFLKGQRGTQFLKGQGTGNDFVLIPDVDGELDLSAAAVRRLCDRRFGIGADGVLRVVRSETDADARPMASQAEFFMDYRNADGSVASMCGNGARVFGRYLVAAGLAEPGRIAFATRGGVRVAQVPEAGDVSVDMGPVIGDSGRVDVKVSNRFGSWQAVSAFVPNPHAVVTLDDLDVLGELEPPSIDAGGLYPDGANVEFVEVLADDHIRMRVHERGVGETLSCGTGACAAAWATWERQRGPEVRSTRVDVPGGTVTVSRDEHGHLHLAGPAVLVARGELMEQWWMGADGG